MKIETLFKQKWKNLESFKNLKNCEYPGIYILAYTNKNLEAKPVKVKDIFYVGMSNSRGGVKQRIKQFIDCLESYRGHSAAMRFYREYSNNKPYSNTKRKNNFYVAASCMKVNVIKETRTPRDLKKMGEITKFEYDVLAHIKEKTGKEPQLNKQ